jgi:hypothetical protein
VLRLYFIACLASSILVCQRNGNKPQWNNLLSFTVAAVTDDNHPTYLSQPMLDCKPNCNKTDFQSKNFQSILDCQPQNHNGNLWIQNNLYNTIWESHLSHYQQIQYIQLAVLENVICESKTKKKRVYEKMHQN